ncbi:energy transducer TonB [Pedobacter psychrophilus]|uniref:Energy transducer TonB n=1 Tax=Pedobacter psychrophilus TaxID=1826909 RepID=A0A179DBU5_9SPHI|nr:TonB-dependent receptor [Pedobacter psychrophilus]OAQ38525.1 energy transducer TonB [Pedobacter psychrophilus]
MKRILYVLIGLFIGFSNAHAADIIFTGKVIDAKTKEPLPGATITIQDLKISAVADINGKFSFNRIPDKGKFLVQISYLGYKYQNQTIDFAITKNIIFELQPSLIEANEVVVTGTVTGADNKKNSTSVGVLSKDEMLDRASSNLIDAVSKVAGVNQITTGQAISKPVIRGLSFNRIVTINNGIKQQGQQWGDEHGIEIDQYSADRIEVLRGAASLLYGADALGGVINILEPLTVPEGTLKGEVLSNYSTNGGLSANSAMLTGNSDGFVWRARGTYKNAFSFKTPDYYYPNSGFIENSYGAMFGLNKAWGYSHVNVSYFNNKIGFYDPVLDGNGKFVDDNGDVITDAQDKSRTLQFPNQDISHFKIASNSNFLFDKGNLKLDLGFQNNVRKELESAVPSLFFDLSTYTLDAKYYIEQKNGWQSVFGLSTDYAHSQNKAQEFLVPDYNYFGIGAFYYVKKDWENSSFNAGLRLDYRNNQGKDLFLNGASKFMAFKTNYSNLSGAAGYTHQFNERFNFKANLSSGFRAPNPAEQGSNGVHEGTFRYEVGTNDLKAERSYQADATFGYATEYFDVNLSVYNNYMTNYIYLAQNNKETIDVEDEQGQIETLPLFRYKQDNADLYGTDVSLIFHPTSFFHFENTFSYVHAENLALNKPLPFIPAASLRNEIRIEPKIKGLKSSYFSLGLDNYFAQNRVDNFETITSGYSLLRAGIGASFNLGKQIIRFNISGNNLLDKKYYDHLSRFKPGRLDEADPNFGIYNQGRNITFGFYLPLSL